jgi:hypothetical protein
MAIIERREIIFDVDEVFDALSKLEEAVAASLKLPRGRPLKVEFDTDAVGVTVQYNASELWVTLDGPRLAAFLMNWCHRKRVPLPKRATKSIGMTTNNVSLILSSDSD